MEEFLQSRVLSGDEMNVVDKQNVGLPVLFPELRSDVPVDRIDKLVRELLAAYVNDPVIGIVLCDPVGYRIEQMGLSDAGRTVYEQRIVGIHRSIGNGKRRGMGKPVGASDDEVFERVLPECRRDGCLVLRPLLSDPDIKVLCGINVSRFKPCRFGHLFFEIPFLLTGNNRNGYGITENAAHDLGKLFCVPVRYNIPAEVGFGGKHHGILRNKRQLHVVEPQVHHGVRKFTYPLNFLQCKGPYFIELFSIEMCIHRCLRFLSLCIIILI